MEGVGGEGLKIFQHQRAEEPPGDQSAEAED